MTAADFVLIEDEFLRDGLQNEAQLFTLEDKLAYVTDLVAAGVRRIQLGSFVHPTSLPQMAGTDALCAALPDLPQVTYTALVLNGAGLARAQAAGLRHLSISVSASQTHSRKNTNRTVEEGRAAVAAVIDRALAAGITVRAGIQSALGCGFEGRIDPHVVLSIAKQWSDLGVSEINLADTAGLANPVQVADLCARVRAAIAPGVALSLHLHDTRGLGMANLLAGLQAGVRIFDTALGGLGGCPFLPDAGGNLATEDVAFALSEMGFATGIDWHALRPAVRRAEARLNRPLPGRMAHVLTPGEPL